MLSKVVSAGVLGVDAYRVEVEVDCARALPSFNMVGLPDGAVKESRDRLRTAIKNSGYAFPQERVTVNLAPADVKKEGSGFDLPVALAVLASDAILTGSTLDLSETMIVGELSLDGSVRPVRGVLPIAAHARDIGIKKLLVPRKNGAEAAVVEGLEVYLADNLSQVVEGINEGGLERAGESSVSPEGGEFAAIAADFSEVRGQAHAKRALEIAAAGAHNVLMVGPPGTGKTMLARRLAAILPEMTRDEAVEVSRIYSVAGLIDPARPLVAERPFRSPHHTVSDAGLVGGGASPRPGEVTLAHNGVLFLDELPEFKRNVLDLLRQPLEDGAVTIVRASGAVSFPARFMLVGAMNPCPCGHSGDPTRECTCAPGAMERYRARVSGPLLDRFDIRIEVPAVRYREMTGEGGEEGSAAIRERVKAARGAQEKRLAGTGCWANSQMGPKAMKVHCGHDADAAKVLEGAMDRMGLSARGYARCLKVARTIADMESSVEIEKRHVLEALQLRMDAALYA